MNEQKIAAIRGTIVEAETALSLGELCRACAVSAEEVIHLVEEGVIEPRGREPRAWRFEAVCVRRVSRAQRLRRDLGVNLAGAALAVELLEELDRLRTRLRRYEPR
jgi:chaperone modulatory protein CbpM